ncbi:uncharacterized protein LOC114357649 [Ostrinia furnacalis]|uniref:uncharacterized protein LOC114357649 n=1 Tax=Ostrinia furnacalis TaxID=93504 RepID=UPI00103D2032|nr:uncharacterized protein LOC114357649 [Ostrinia furnacalis]
MDITRKLTKALIEMYFDKKCLWQVHSEEYKRRDLKKKAYQDIVAFLRRNGVKDANVKLVRDKIQNMRRAMRKEKKRIDDSVGTYSPTLWYYDLLTFVNHRNIQNEQNSSNSDTTSCPVINIDESDEEVTLQELRDNVLPNEEEMLDLSVIPLPPAQKKASRMKNINDEHKALGISVASKMRRMEEYQQIYAELLIQKVIARGLLGQLHQNTDIVDVVQDNDTVISSEE